MRVEVQLKKHSIRAPKGGGFTGVDIRKFFVDVERAGCCTLF